MRDRILENFEDNKEIGENDLDKKTTPLEAVHLLRSSWNRISADTIRNCFAHGGFWEALDEKLQIVIEPPVCKSLSMKSGCPLPRTFQ
ncbi:hypothetical protein AVEN_153695-1 [Araneus ventricosus]|uniref:DDE-1 domain-containing protein n=1 Tax=Araneus ventricosus TaxID=182803 RepID=A0A4Y2G1I7_ARAVE|nr:hypothetical protein AVEN_153695-1 [Araneus ventricosus]